MPQLHSLSVRAGAHNALMPESLAVQVVQLSGALVQLEPLALQHSEDLFAASRDESIWKYLLVPQPTTVEEMKILIEGALVEQEKGLQLAFAVRTLAAGRIVGTTRYLDIRPFDLALEIGWTWYASGVQRTGVNTECKFLLLEHAFETLGCRRVQLKTDAQNERSRAAIERIGAKFEGILKQYQRYWHGAQRDTAMYAITSEDWGEVKSHLTQLKGKAQRAT